ncbi:MAG: hypothetical protein GXP31_08125 [Kiritimatiellaeota bacterium]|nr:hypothetical protein [Kiritimatiellota bacterium]
MKSISWLFFRIRVPEAWEMARYSLTRASGRVMFADDRAERLHFTWQRIGELPRAGAEVDVRQRLQAVRRELDRPREKLVPGDIEVVAPGWLGFRVTGTRHALIAARYLTADDDHYLLEAEFDLTGPWAAAAREVLRSVGAREENVWRAYHLSFVLPDSWEPADARIYPGSSELEFHRSQERLQLYSINPKTTEQTIENMIGRLMHAKERILERTTCMVGPHRAVRVETGRLAARGFVGRLRRVHDYFAYTGWDCANRTPARRFLVRYRRQVLGAPPLPDDLELRCCQ